MPLGFPSEPEDLAIDDEGNPLRIDKAYSWEAPIANHGLMHMAITNAVAGDPYDIDTMIFYGEYGLEFYYEYFENKRVIMC